MQKVTGLKLYNNRNGSNPKRVRMFLAEKGLEVDLEPVSFAKLEHRSAEFRAKNPMATLPMIELDDGTIITESYAICRYLEDLYPEPNLFGETPLERAQIEMWNRRIEFDVANYITMIMKHTGEFFAPVITQVPEYADACRTDLMKKYDWLNEELGTRDYIAGDRFTVVDITAYGRIGMRDSANADWRDDHTNLQAWWDRISARPSADA
ncbi:MAG: glutathione S-transferase family protein [Alphaproteobacteria bacterium]